MVAYMYHIFGCFTSHHKKTATMISSSAIILQRRFLLARRTLATTTDTREAERAAKRARRNAAAKKQAAVQAYLENAASKNQASSAPNNQGVVEDKTRGEQWRDAEREALIEEAGVLARSLYRACLRSIRTLCPGNEHDEKDFKEREAKQIADLDDDSSAAVFSMEPPVNRKNELKSRADYYSVYLRENFNSDSQCLDASPWKEHHVDAFLNFMRAGEKNRRYVLRDYRFDDPYKINYDKDRINQFEQRADLLIRDTYQAKGWLHSTDIKTEDHDFEYDPDFDVEDDPSHHQIPKA